ncbi:MAG: flavodoxin-dependent (E)-4-hydroxy-3-methylbut-2-enyl-diphosphate synthase [Oscillospiraceae bacterium]|nr:flavodoxin-dependent (E)-4-hydroxy-3-methylbut-2-enyl-diphosphate synthase [Oscillospiraceae bacterium]
MEKKIVKVGNLAFGDGNIHVQSMLSLPADDVDGNIAQAQRLVEVGCDVIRVAVPEKSDVRLISELKKAVTVPIVADIHFDYRIALESVAAGADKIRINPGNIGDDDRVRAVVNACKNARNTKGGRGIPIRVGANSGSTKDGKGIVDSALENVRLLERFDFNDIVVSVKSSSVLQTIAAYRELSKLIVYPLHLGVTEAGTARMGLVKSAIGIGSLLSDNIGDTIRVSLTATPEDEVKAAIDILRAIGKRKSVEIISCPTCGRCKIDVLALVEQLEVALQANSSLESRLATDGTVIAVMGCIVNGPGECKDADFGITGGDGVGVIFAHGEIVRKVDESQLISALLELLQNHLLLRNKSLIKSGEA